jgi:hypothetical protein
MGLLRLVIKGFAYSEGRKFCPFNVSSSLRPDVLRFAKWQGLVRICSTAAELGHLFHMYFGWSATEVVMDAERDYSLTG